MPTPFTYDPSPPKPHVHPLVAPGGRVLTRSETPDHPWQRGVWFAVKFVNGENFWEELDAFGAQRHADDETVEWVRPGGDVVIEERRTLTPVDEHTFDWTSALTAAVDVELDRTPYEGWGGYGGLGFRGAGDWHDTRLATETGSGASVIGVRSRWCDLSGPDAGVTIHDHPTNPRHPTPWYGNVANAWYDTDEPTNFFNAAFLFHDPLAVEGGATITFRHRVEVHDGLATWDRSTADAAWERFARD